MRVARQNEIHARNLRRESVGLVLSRGAPPRLAGLRVPLEALVRQDDDEIAPLLLAQLRHAVFGHGQGLHEPEALDQARAHPVRRSRRREAEDADAHASDLLDDVGRERLTVAEHQCIGRQPRELRLTLGRVEPLDAEIELVVSDGHGVVAHEVHRADDRVDRLLAGREGERLFRRSLDRVPGVEEEHRPAFGADGLDRSRDAREALAEVRVRERVDRVHAAVQVARVEDRQANVPGRRRRRRRAGTADTAATRAAMRTPTKISRRRTRGSYTPRGAHRMPAHAEKAPGNARSDPATRRAHSPKAPEGVPRREVRPGSFEPARASGGDDPLRAEHRQDGQHGHSETLFEVQDRRGLRALPAGHSREGNPLDRLLQFQGEEPPGDGRGGRRRTRRPSARHDGTARRAAGRRDGKRPTSSSATPSERTRASSSTRTSGASRDAWDGRVRRIPSRSKSISTRSCRRAGARSPRTS